MYDLRWIKKAFKHYKLTFSLQLGSRLNKQTASLFFGIMRQ